jgi:hypothetical protein
MPGPRFISDSIIAVLILYFVFSALRQLAIIIQLSLSPDQTVPRWKRVLLKGWFWNKSRLFPVFTFFGHLPEIEVHLLFRDKLANQQMTPWKQVDYEFNPVIRWLWNPDRRRQKALVDLTGTLLILLFREPDPQFPNLFRQATYIKLATYMAGLPSMSGTIGRQFLLAATPIPPDSRPLEIVFISPLHPISNSGRESFL